MLEAPLAGLAELIATDTELRALVAWGDKTQKDQTQKDQTQLDVVLPNSARAFVISALALGSSNLQLVVTATGREAEDLANELRDMLGFNSVELFPSWETLPHERLSPSADTVGTRLKVLHRLANQSTTQPKIIVTTVRSLVQPMAPELANLPSVVVKVGAETDFDELIIRLAEMAYDRVDMVGRRGEFAVRGGIIDVFPTTADHPVRIEFFGDEITELRPFAVADQRTLPEVVESELTLFPCREILLTKEVRNRAAALAIEHSSEKTLVEMLEKISAGIAVEGMEALIPVLIRGKMQVLSEIVPSGSTVVVLDPEKIRTRAGDLVRTGEEFLEASWSAAALGAAGPIDAKGLDLVASSYRSLTEVQEITLAAQNNWWTFAPLSAGPDANEVQLSVQPGPQPRGNDEQIAVTFAQLRAQVNSGGTAAVVAPGKGTLQRLRERLTEADVPVGQLDSGVLQSGVVNLLCGTLFGGAVFPAMNVVVVADADLTGNRVSAGKETKKLAAKRRNQVDPLALSSGDMVVHDQHGIGKFIEMIERTVGGARREYLVVEYAPSKRGHPGDRLFVPMDSLDQLSRYVGGEKPSLSKLGGSDWQNTKRKARKAVREIAGELVQLYAARQAAPGFAFSPDSPWQREMEDAFGFTETEDQLTVIGEVKADMEKPVPMDRVVVGDVGYGKTEIAVRAAFKAVQDGKQVAVLVPTTILAQQHLQTFSERMAGFPVRVAGLSRFTDTKESKVIIAKLASGEVDIVVGTHRLLQSSVMWHDLGLVVVDEEQRFGVEHKEHIKALRTHVDVLTMSATPIPRTLEMSMAGIREMSTILTPPEERHPILTYVGAYQPKQVAAAIRRELLRDGQIFFVHNRVSTIDETAQKIRDLVPEARVVVAHGQLHEDQLESTVESFWQREFDVLVCTTIIETGLDISNANTLIVDRAEALGLSQLHQLRGRVGRSRERGYAYFLYNGEKTLTETAYDRLATIAQNNELGAGMAVALKDLELRGAGNVLGEQQSGHVAGVGFDLYVRLVGEAVEAYRAINDGEPILVQENTEVRVDLPVDAHIPVDYVDSDRLRLEGYRKIAAAQSDTELSGVLNELIDRYGTPPTELLRLFSVAKLRLLCRELNLKEVIVAGEQIKLSAVNLLDSQQVRLNRIYKAINYRAVSGTLTLPIPRTGGVGSARVRDVELIQVVADLVLVIKGENPGSVDMRMLVDGKGKS